MANGICPLCNKAASSLHWIGDGFSCRHCLSEEVTVPALIQYEQVTPEVKSSKAHIADIKSRRLDTKTGRMYYDTGSRRYFY